MKIKFKNEVDQELFDTLNLYFETIGYIENITSDGIFYKQVTIDSDDMVNLHRDKFINFLEYIYKAGYHLFYKRSEDKYYLIR